MSFFKRYHGIASTTACLVAVLVAVASGGALASQEPADQEASILEGPLPEAVEALAADYSIGQEEARARLRHQHEIFQLAGAYQSLEPDTFAGAWIDHSDGGSFNLAATAPPAGPTLDSLRALASPVVADRLRFHNVGRSSRSLYALRDAVARLPLVRESASVAIGVSARHNAVTLDFFGPVEEVDLDALRAHTGDSVIIQYSGDFEEPSCTRFACDHEGLMRRGLRINSCTSGFTAWSPNNSSRYTITAGHCYNAPTSAHHNGVRVGGVPYSSWEDTGTIEVDAARVILDSGNFTGTRWVWHTSGAQRLAITEVVNSQTVRNSGQGTYICRSRTADALRCGEITHPDTTTVQNDGQRTIHNVFRYGVRGCSGHSGAPVYSSTSPRTAFGIHIASGGPGAGNSLLTGSTCRAYSVANHINDVENHLTVYVLTN